MVQTRGQTKKSLPIENKKVFSSIITKREIKNKTGRVLYNVTTITPHKGYHISLNDAEIIYNRTIIKRKKDNIPFSIKVLTIDGWKTLSSFTDMGDTLKYAMDDYYKSISVENRKKFNNFLVLEIYFKNL
jgi:hypothetical protein